MIKNVSKKLSELRGEITIPADKSVSHRAVMLSSLAKGKTIIHNCSKGADCKSTIKLFQQLGVEINYLDENTLEVNSNGVLTQTINNYYCGNSGTTMRLVSGILARQNFNSILFGDESLSKRPMKRIVEPLILMGAEISSEDGHAPLLIQGRTLHGIEYNSQLSSAQVKSCVLLAGLGAKGKTIYTEPYQSRNHTEIMLEYLGANINTDSEKIELYPSELTAKDIDVIGDISSAAFFIVAGLIVPNSDFVIKNVGINYTRSGIIDVIWRMGGYVEYINQRVVSGEEVADLRVKYTGNLKACTIQGAEIPRLIDELPVIAVLATQAEGVTIVKNAQDLRNKEADRIHCLVEELKKIGVSIEETQDGFLVAGKSVLKGGAELETYHDHRLAMSFYVAGLICKNEIAINGFEWTNISFPEFEKLFNELS